MREPIKSQRSALSDESWVRMPKPKERLLGLSRTTLLESVVLRKRHAQRGIRLVFLPSLLEYLEQLHKKQEAAR